MPPLEPSAGPGGQADRSGVARGDARSSARSATVAGRTRLGTRTVSSNASERAGRRRSRVWLWTGAGVLAVVVAVVAVSVLMLGRSGPAHVLVMPDKLGSYVRRPQLELQMHARDLQQQLVAKSAGQVSHVVYAVYGNNSDLSGTSQQVILFIGGNLSGISPSGFIASFSNQFKGARSTSAGSMGGRAACVSAQANLAGGVALCTWADNDAFGVVASPTMDAEQLGAQMRVIRPQVERTAK